MDLLFLVLIDSSRSPRLAGFARGRRLAARCGEDRRRVGARASRRWRRPSTRTPAPTPQPCRSSHRCSRRTRRIGAGAAALEGRGRRRDGGRSSSSRRRWAIGGADERRPLSTRRQATARSSCCRCATARDGSHADGHGPRPQSGRGAEARRVTRSSSPSIASGGFVASGTRAARLHRARPWRRVAVSSSRSRTSTDVGRYRVSFRTDAGIVRHVDRRARTAAAGPAVKAS